MIAPPTRRAPSAASSSPWAVLPSPGPGGAAALAQDAPSHSLVPAPARDVPLNLSTISFQDVAASGFAHRF